MTDMKKRQVIVVGGGIGGSSAAFHMKQLGIDVLMLEKDQFPRDKPCGDGVIPAVFPVLRNMGVYDQVVAEGYPSGYIRLYAPDDTYFRMSNTTTLEGEEAPMYCIPRYRFDDMVNKAAVNAGVDYLENFEVTEILMERGQAKGIRGIHNGKAVEIESDMVVLASGSHSMVARQMGFYEENPDYVFYGLRGYFNDIEGLEDVEFYYPDKFLPTGYIWLFPTGKTSANVGVFITESALKKTGMTSEELLWEWIGNTHMGHKRLGHAKLIGKLKGWRLPSGKRKPIYAGGVMAVGDAGNMIEQYGGGGIPQAMVAGTIAAQTAKNAIQANDFSKAFMKNYSDAVDQAFSATYIGMEALRQYAFGTPEQLKNTINWMNEHEAEDASMQDYLFKGLKLDPTKLAGQMMSHF